MRLYEDDKRLVSFSIKSVLRQTHSNLRVVVYCDGGQDVAWITKKFADPRLSVTRGEVNLGRGGACNALLDLIPEDCHAFTWLDSDGDLYMPKALEVAAAAIVPVFDREFWAVRVRGSLEGGWKDKSMGANLQSVSAAYHMDWQALIDGGVKRNHPYGRIGLGLYGRADTLYLPRFVKDKVRFDQRALCGEETGWTRDVEQWAINEYDLFGFNENRWAFVQVYGGLEATHFHLRSSLQKYVGVARYSDFHGTYQTYKGFSNRF